MYEKEKSQFPNFTSMDSTHKGWLLMIAGFILLANIVGLLSGHVSFVLMLAAALYLIIMGAIKAQLHIPLRNFLHNHSRKK